MRAKDGWAMLVVVILCAGSLTGCLSGEDESDERNPIQMNVHYDATAGIITERVQNGAVLSQNGVELAFDFARVTSNAGNMETFTLDPGDDVDGSNSITVQANEQAEITYTYQTHGLFTALLSATDENENEASIELVIRIEKRRRLIGRNPTRMNPTACTFPQRQIASAKGRSVSSSTQPSAIRMISSGAHR